MGLLGEDIPLEEATELVSQAAKSNKGRYVRNASSSENANIFEYVNLILNVFLQKMTIWV